MYYKRIVRKDFKSDAEQIDTFPNSELLEHIMDCENLGSSDSGAESECSELQHD
mgnify:CR=1 FL=1